MARAVSFRGRPFASRAVRRLGESLLVLATLVSCHRTERVPTAVVIVGIDTLRADHLGCYGYARPTSPRIDALAAESVLFEDAISQSPWTLPGFASIFTGMVPERHGAGEGKRCLVKRCGALAPDLSTLAELFLRAGWRTASFVSNGFAGKAVGLGRGFEEVPPHRISGAFAVDDAIAWLERHQDERLFLFVHIVDPHSPYRPPPEDAAPFLDPAYAGPVGPANADAPSPDWTDADRRRVVDLYDGEIRFTDRLTGRLVDALARLGIADRTLLVVTADHGEELFERGGLGHGHTMYEELLHVPLIVRFPGGAPRGRIAHQVRTMDVFPTVLEAAGLPVPERIDAVSLLGLARGGAPPAPTAVAIAQFTFVEPELRAARRDRRKLVVDVDAPAIRLFDLANDPGERDDVAARFPERVASLREELDRIDAASIPGLHVLARGGREPHRLRIELHAPTTRFAAPILQSSEPDDAARLAPEQGTVTIEFALAPHDQDGLRLVADGGAIGPVTLVSVTLDGRPFALDRLELGTTGPRPNARLPLTIAPPEVAVRRIAMPEPTLDARVGVAVQAVVPGVGPSLRIDPATHEALRALGYAE